MGVNYETSFLDGTTRVIELLADNEPVESGVLPAAIVPLSGGGVVEFRPLNVLYSVDTAISGASALTVDSAIIAKTPSEANLVVGGDTYAYTVNRANATFSLATPLTQTYTAGTQVSISTASGTIDIDMRDADFQVLNGGPNDQITVQSVGRDLNLVVPPDLSYSQTPNTAEVLIRTSASTPWKPSDATTTGTMPYWEPAGVFWNDDLIANTITWESVDGNWRLISNYSSDADKFSLTTGAQNYVSTTSANAAPFTLQQKTSSNPDVWVDRDFDDGAGNIPLLMLLCGDADFSSTFGVIVTEDGSADNLRIRYSSDRVDVRGGTSGSGNFNGESSSNVLDFDSSGNWEHDFVDGEPFAILGKNITSVDAPNFLFSRNGGNLSLKSPVIGLVLLLDLATDDLSEADEQLLYRYAHQQYLTNWGFSPISATLQDRDVAPTAGSTNAINVSTPTLTFDRIVSGAPVSSAIAIFERSTSLIADRSQFTLAAGNNSGNNTLVVNETIPNDTPTSGHIRVLRDDGSEDRLAFSSWDTSTFTLGATLPATYSSGNGAYVGYLDVLGSSTGTESINLEYVANRDCVLTVRLGSGAGRTREIRQNITLGASDFEFQVSAIADAINQST